MTIHRDTPPRQVMMHYGEAPKDGSTYDFVQVPNSLQADKFMQAENINEAWLFRARGRLYLTWKTKG